MNEILDLFDYELYKAKKELRKRRKLDFRQIPSEKDRIRKAKKKGGFDDSWIDEDAKKNLDGAYSCYFCKKPMKPLFGEVNTKGKITMTCDTDDCPGNYAEKRSSYSRQHKKFFGRVIDKKVCFDLASLLIGRDPSRLWATRKRTI